MHAYPRLSFNLFVHITPSHQSHGYWRHPNGRHMIADYNQLDPWVELAKSCERARFDAMFIGDTMGAYHEYKNSQEPGIRSGMQFPGSDPSVLVSAMAYATENLGFVVTSGILQAHPFEFARRMSTLDHLTRGRVGWNVVTSYLETAARNLGLDGLPEHDRRYDMADEYLEVAYKLWEASWDDAAVVADVDRNVLFEPSLVRPISHEGTYYRSAGPHLAQPSPQRTPVLYQAGGSPAGKRFAGKHAEATFLGSYFPELARDEVRDVQSRAVEAGRQPGDILPLVIFSPVIGSTEEEARRKQRELREWADYDAIMTSLGARGFADVDPDARIEQILADPLAAGIDASGSQLAKNSLAMLEKAPDTSATFREFVIDGFSTAGRVAGTPEQLADEIQAWVETGGVAGFNVIPVTTLGWVDEWADHVVPVLQERGLLQQEYAEGTLREKLFGRDPVLPEYHAGRAVRQMFAQ